MVFRMDLHGFDWLKHDQNQVLRAWGEQFGGLLGLRGPAVLGSRASPLELRNPKPQQGIKTQSPENPDSPNPEARKHALKPKS